MNLGFMQPPSPRFPQSYGRSDFDDELRYDEDIEELAFKNVVLLLDDEKEHIFEEEEVENVF